jgi:hypothetical protein
MSERVFVLIVDRAVEGELNAVQQIVKANSREWWHQFTNTWIVLDKSPSEWIDLIRPALTSPESSTLVMELARSDGESPRWSLLAPKTKSRQYSEWLHSGI